MSQNMNSAKTSLHSILNNLNDLYDVAFNVSNEIEQKNHILKSGLDYCQAGITETNKINYIVAKKQK